MMGLIGCLGGNSLHKQLVGCGKHASHSKEGVLVCKNKIFGMQYSLSDYLSSGCIYRTELRVFLY